jgi:hypothetical protein
MYREHISFHFCDIEGSGRLQVSLYSPRSEFWVLFVQLGAVGSPQRITDTNNLRERHIHFEAVVIRSEAAA